MSVCVLFEALLFGCFICLNIVIDVMVKWRRRVEIEEEEEEEEEEGGGEEGK